MIVVGVHEFRSKLSHYLRLAREDQVVLITRRKRPVAVLRKVHDTVGYAQHEAIAVLVAAGKLKPAKEPGLFKPFKPIKMRGKPLSQMIIDDRR